MIEIRHKETGAVLHRVEAGTLENARLPGLNLSGADLSGANLAGADLTGSLFREADLRRAHLARANMTSTYLLQADLREADLSHAVMIPASLDGADLSGADLSGSNLAGAYMADAKLVRATLSYANLQSTYMGGADLTGARAAFTLFADCPSLHLATGLETIQHLSPSSVDVTTLRAGASTLPDAFLLGVGLTREEIDGVRSLYSHPTSPSSCLLVSDPADAGFAERLRAGLLARSVNCWPYCADLRAGYVHQTMFNVAMRRHDRLVFVCSQASLRQSDLFALVAAALERERDSGARKLFAVTADEFLFRSEARRIGEEKLACGEWREDWIGHLREHATPPVHPGSAAPDYVAQLEALLVALAGAG